MWPANDILRAGSACYWVPRCVPWLGFGKLFAVVGVELFWCFFTYSHSVVSLVHGLCCRINILSAKVCAVMSFWLIARSCRCQIVLTFFHCHGVVGLVHRLCLRLNTAVYYTEWLRYLNFVVVTCIIYRTFLKSCVNTTPCLRKNDTGVAHYNFDAHQPILVVFGRDVAERVCYQMMICYPSSHN